MAREPLTVSNHSSPDQADPLSSLLELLMQIATQPDQDHPETTMAEASTIPAQPGHPVASVQSEQSLTEEVSQAQVQTIVENLLREELETIGFKSPSDERSSNEPVQNSPLSDPSPKSLRFQSNSQISESENHRKFAFEGSVKSGTEGVNKSRKSEVGSPETTGDRAGEFPDEIHALEPQEVKPREADPRMSQNGETVEKPETPSWMIKEPTEPLERLHYLLSDIVEPGKQTQVQELERKVGRIERRFNQPEEMISLLVPLIADVLSTKVAQSKQEMIEAIVPIIDSVIEQKSHRDREAMSKALASVIPGAITQQINESPEEVIQAIAPAMGKAITEQIRIERDSMVDALYPVIGNTIAKYMAEAIREINRKVENTLSLEGVQRKIRARVQGVSEAELILRESIRFSTQAIFLIHKASGLVISGVQKSNDQQLEAEMLAGMLTAIRSFASECIVQPENPSELKVIEYDNFTIVMEVAGYCYIAAVINGEPPKSFLEKLRYTLGSIVLYNRKTIESFDGDPDKVPEVIHQLMQALLDSDQQVLTENQRYRPPALLVIAILALSAIAVPAGMALYNSRLAAKAIAALSATPELAVYRLGVKASWNQLQLTGQLPNELLRQKADRIARSAVPDLAIDNQILAVDVPPDPVLVTAEVKRLLRVFNQMPGIILAAEYQDQTVNLRGIIDQIADANRVTQAFESIPGVKKVTFLWSDRSLPIDKRLYFELNSARINSNEIREILVPIQQFLEQYPDLQIKIIGHTDLTGSLAKNEKLSRLRAEAVKKALVQRGISAKRLHIESSSRPPSDLSANSPDWLGRCVRFERILSPHSS